MFPFDDVIGGAALRGRPLLGQDLVVIAVIRRAIFAGAIALPRCRGKQLAERALLFALRQWPIETVFLAGRADEALGINVGACAGAIRTGVIILRVDISKTGLDRGEFIVSDTPIEDFAAPGCGIERPGAVFIVRHRDRKRIIIIADHQDRLVVAFIVISCLAS